MPLLRGQAATTEQGIAENTRRLIREGYSPDQATAIAHSIADEERNKRGARKFSFPDGEETL